MPIALCCIRWSVRCEHREDTGDTQESQTPLGESRGPQGHRGSPQGSGSAKHERERRGEVKEKEERGKKGENLWTSAFTGGQGTYTSKRWEGISLVCLNFSRSEREMYLSG